MRRSIVGVVQVGLETYRAKPQLEGTGPNGGPAESGQPPLDQLPRVRTLPHYSVAVVDTCSRPRTEYRSPALGRGNGLAAGMVTVAAREMARAAVPVEGPVPWGVLPREGREAATASDPGQRHSRALADLATGRVRRPRCPPVSRRHPSSGHPASSPPDGVTVDGSPSVGVSDVVPDSVGVSVGVSGDCSPSPLGASTSAATTSPAT